MTKRSEEAGVKAIAAIAAFVLVTICAWMSTLAADPHAAPASPETSHATPAETHTSTAESHATHPESHSPAANEAVLPPPGIRWPAIMMMIVLGMFLAAAAIGWAVRMNMPEEVPQSHSHDESHGHGHDAAIHGHATGLGGHH
ncbi:MAG: hypothetical protein QOF78_1791 [Phycisphaerales bacterium]|nr:hypothetical protein [Phycisphaerales bacterium]